MSEELKPCPHCGAPGEVKKIVSSSKIYSFAAVARCSECHHVALAISQEAANRKAAESWNTRAPTPPAPVTATVSDEMVIVAQKAYDALVNPSRENGVGMSYSYSVCMRAALEAYESSRGAGDGWVSCSERMPERDARCLVWILGLEFIGELTRQGWVSAGRILSGSEIPTHWRPLPPPPTDKALEE